MNTQEALLNRRSIREYEKGFIVPEEDIQKIITAGMYAPSAMNKRPWEFMMITDPVLLAQVQETHPYASFLSDAGVGIVVCVNTQKEYAEMGVIDTALAAQNIMIAAYDLGYGTCYCGIYPTRCEEFAHLLQVPSYIKPMGLIALGKPIVQPGRPQRYEADKVHINKW